VPEPLFGSSGVLGPATRALLTRTLVIYGVLFLAGLVPLLVGAMPAWQAAGLGLWLPGGGFLALGGLAALLFPLTLFVFALAVFFWFGAGAVVAPVTIWLGTAALAGAMAAGPIWPAAPYIDGGIVAALFIRQISRRRTRVSEGGKKRAELEVTLPRLIAEAKTRAAPALVPGEGELAPDEIASLRYAIDRGLQPITEWNGFDVYEEYQTSARRYQIQILSFALSLAQANFMPSFHGYLSRAQRNMIDRYLQREVWDYWITETAWGHLNFTNFDPAGKDNIMMTGFLSLMSGLYMSASGDRRYAEPGSLPFKLNERTTFRHDVHVLAGSVISNLRQSQFCLYPCEPNWIYPICNHGGMASLVVYDRLFGTSYTQEIRDRWLSQLDRELTDPAGNIIGLRSTYTGIEFRFPSSELGYAIYTNAFKPAKAWRQWAQARADLVHVVKPDAQGNMRLVLPGRGYDLGHYRPGHGAAYSAIANTAREFGDYELAAAALRSLEADSAPTREGGVLRYTNASNASNGIAAQASVSRRDGYRNALVNGPPESVFRGPVLEDARYPDVLVAKAFSRGDDLELVLYNGGAPGPQTLGLERLKPHKRYSIRGVGADRMRFEADGAGRAQVSVVLDGRTAIHVQPAE
jgi:hypothetical protein